ncbi:AI-2E family transporter [Candidatus Gracilibacteria bacterium]|nr:AI-2E family transporter [Candidatus Gracilibacteria bacterium]MCF7856433.1 AI-2E family transporter [Candidatus Gracilibacteria bacterium]MCF7896572.1 AI-2E family transporter [Candidatus Gracilibacteria bacterium]
MIDNFSDLFGKAKRVLKSLREEADRNREEGSRLLALEKKLATKEGAKETHHTTVDVSTTSVAKSALTILGILALGWFVLEIKNVIALFFVATFLALALDPFVDKMQKWKIPRGVGALLIYIIFVGVTGIVISSFVPILAGEIPKLATAVLDWVNGFGIETTAIQNQITSFQHYLSNIQQNLNQENIKAGLNVLGTIGQNAFAVVKSIAGGVVNFVLVFVIAFFMIIDEDGIKSFLIALFPRRFHRYILEKGAAVENKFGAWVRGQAILMVVMGFLIFIALKIAGIQYAATLGTLAALTELVPYVGPIIAFIPAAILALSQGGWFLAFVVTLIYVGIQQLEGNVLIPLIMKKAVGLSPVIIMFAMFVGASFPATINPIVGIIISVPIATAISVFVRDYATKEK